MQKWFLARQILLISALALLSGYQIPNLDDSNWLTVLFLTPFGVIYNHLNANSLIRPFYGEVSEGQIAISRLSLTVMGFVYLLMIGNVVRLLRKSKP